jgi:non-ribosomal peptide synthetase component F
MTEEMLPPRRLELLFEAQARMTPDATALIHGGQSVTYAELDRRSNQFAQHLRTLPLVRRWQSPSAFGVPSTWLLRCSAF